MTVEDIRDGYYHWLVRKVTKNDSYSRLLRHLNEIAFRWDIPMDANRSEDGCDLRYRYGSALGYTQAEVANTLDCRDCSVLEMLIALSLRCEETIMDNTDIGNRTGLWFWNMVDTLGLGGMINNNYDEAFVDAILMRWMDHRYSPKGKGGLFFVRNPPKDMRTVEIWYQMYWYLNEIS